MDNKCYFGDCLEIMPGFPDKSFDMILADLPYGQTAPTWDKIIDMKLMWEQYNRLIKDGGVVALFASQPFTTKLINSNIENFKYCWYWIKSQGTNFFHASRMPIRKVEEICIFGGKRYYPQKTDGHSPTHSAIGKSHGKAYFGTNVKEYRGGETSRFPTNILDFKSVNNFKRLHSSEKPVELCEYLIKTYTTTGDIVMDNTAGSGTTGVAAMNLSRRFVLIENDPEYFEIMTNRLKTNSSSIYF